MKKVFRNFPKEIHRLNNGHKPKQNARNGRFTHNPQDSESISSFNSLRSKESKIKECPVESGGNVAKRAACMRQVFASLEVAETMVHKLKGLGIVGNAYRCGVCNLVHVLELRP